MNQAMIGGIALILAIMLMSVTQPLSAAFSGLMVYSVYQSINAIGSAWIGQQS